MNGRGKRVEELDILKDIAIICMVAGHAGAPFTHFIYLFHMAVFFMASGYFYKDSSSDQISSVFKVIRKQLMHLWVPFFCCNAVYVLLHNLFLRCYILNANPDVTDYLAGKTIDVTASYSPAQTIRMILLGMVFGSEEQMFGTGWFLKILFMISITYTAIDFLLKKCFRSHVMAAQLVVSVLLLLMGYALCCRGFLSFGIAQTASYYCLYYMGHVLGACKDRIAGWQKKQYAFTLLASFGILLILNRTGSIELSYGHYENPLYLLVTSLAGWVFLYSISYFLNRLPVFRRPLIFVGRRTLPVMLIHSLAFKLAEILVIYCYRLPIFCLAVFPNLYGERNAWWLLYTIVGVCIPMLADTIWRQVKASLNRVVSLQYRTESNDRH